MGWWGYDLLSGDPPMDTLAFLGDAIGTEDLYPLKFTHAQAARVRGALEARGEALMEDEHLASDMPVVAAAFMACGAAMPDALRAAAIEQARDEAARALDEGWHDGGQGRRLTMTHLADLVAVHVPGQRVTIEHVGLLDTMASHLSDEGSAGSALVNKSP